MEITFVNLLGASNKENVLVNTVAEVSRGYATSFLYLRQDKLFKSIEGCPFAYQAPHPMLSLSAKRQILSTNGIIARQGVGAATRFHRLVWEVPSRCIGKEWLHMAHGTSPSKYYKPTTHVFLWANSGKEAKADVIQRYPYLKGNYGFKIQAEHYYRSPGLCYGKRTENFTVQVLPSNHLFSFEGTAVFTDGSFLDEWSLLALLNSAPVNYWLSIVCAEHKAYNYVEAIPVPESIGEADSLLREKAQKGWLLQRDIDTNNLTSTVFIAPAIQIGMQQTLALSASNLKNWIKSKKRALAQIQRETDSIISSLYNLTEGPSLIEESVSEDLGEEKDNEKESVDNVFALVCQNLNYFLGVFFGRWDIRILLNPTLAPKLPEAFEPLPSCPPGMLAGVDGLPALPNNIVSEEWLRARPDANTLPSEGTVTNSTIPDSEYPVRISWNGILVDDEGHPEDIIARVRKAIEVIWQDKAEDIEQEAIEILGTSSLREYFTKPNKFFADHLKRYSKSRRQAPIYWPLSTPSGSYTLWLYYHRLTDQTLYTCVNDYVEEQKIKEVTDSINALQAKSKRSRQEEKQLEDLSDFKQELVDFRDELLRVAKFWKPNLNDGVQITASPLWQLFRHRPWQNKLKDTWQKLENGDYDWAHLALSIWPKRVVKAAHNDRSIAIAHDLEEALWEEVEVGQDRQGNPKYQWQPKDLSQKEMDSIIRHVSVKG